MKWLAVTILAVILAGLPVGTCDVLAAQDNPPPPIPKGLPSKNPLEGNSEAVRAGMGLFRVRCADCHGMDARGIRAPDLTQVWARGRTDDGLFRTLRTGVSGTEMPAVIRASDDDVWRILAYLRTLAAPTPTDPLRGNATSGERLFRAHCSSCHRVGQRGGRLGPDLSRIGIARTPASLTRQIRGAVEDFKSGYEPVTLTTGSGSRIHGVKKNEDLFSVQIMDSGERIQGYLKEDLKQVTDEKKSAMPAFGPERFSQEQLDDLLAYLSSLRGTDKK